MFLIRTIRKHREKGQLHFGCFDINPPILGSTLTIPYILCPDAQNLGKGACIRRFRSCGAAIRCGYGLCDAGAESSTTADAFWGPHTGPVGERTAIEIGLPFPWRKTRRETRVAIMASANAGPKENSYDALYVVQSCTRGMLNAEFKLCQCFGYAAFSGELH